MDKMVYGHVASCCAFLSLSTLVVECFHSVEKVEALTFENTPLFA